MTDLDLYEAEEEKLPTPAEVQQEAEEEMRSATERVAKLSAELAEIASEPIEDDDRSHALVSRASNPAQKKRELGVLRARATRRAQEIEAKREEIRAASREMENAMAKQMQLAKDALAPLEKFVARLEEGIWMVNLYLGRDEEILSLRDGDPAPAEEPVTIRQLVLYMDEECAINPENDGIDVTEIDLFDKWLQADPRHVEQVLPERKGVVALRPRRKGKHYADDPWKQAALDEANKQTYFLIRNGDKLWRTWTTFNTGERLVPLADEFGSFFYEKRHTTHRERGLRDHMIPLQPGTPAWERAEEQADARQRHYMRVGLILQGLVDRTTVFHPLRKDGINFMDFEQNNESWRFLSDAEKLIGTGRQPYRDWIRERAQMLQVGMRIIGSFASWDNREKWEGRISPSHAERPPTGELLLLEEKDSSGNFLVRYRRKEEVWARVPGRSYNEYRHTKRRASCSVHPDDREIIPFDLVTEEEMLAYLNARLDRHNYAEMFPLLKAAIRAKRAEREEERPFRTMLIGVLARDNDVPVDEAELAVDELIVWWKTSNRWHRPLIGDEESQAKAVRAIVAEHARRLRASGRDIPPRTIERIKEGSPGLIAILRRRSTGNFIAITPESHPLYKNVDYETPYVQASEYTTTGKPKDVKPWFMLSPSWLSKLDVIYATERFDQWPRNASVREHLTGPELMALAQQLGMLSPALREAAVYDPHKGRFYTWTWEGDADLDISSPFTAKPSGPKVHEQSRGWQRKGHDGPKLTERWGSGRPNYSYQTRPWDTRPVNKKSQLWWDDEQVEAEAMAVNKYIVLFLDEELVARYDSEKERYEQAYEALQVPKILARGYLKSIEHAWVARKEQQTYDRFLEDFLDPELWEGHKKTLPRETFEYPYSHYRSWRSEPDALALLVEYSVEQGTSLGGLTVREAADAFPPKEWLDKRLANEWPSTSVPGPAAIPEDLHELRFAAPQQEDDTEDDDA